MRCKECGRWGLESDLGFGLKVGGLIGLGIGMMATVGLLVFLG